MKNKVLVDTSAWIAGFRKTAPEGLKKIIKETIEADLVVITPLIMLELLQVCKTEKEFEALKTRIMSLQIYSMEDLEWSKIFHFGFSLRKRGITVPTMDILIAFIAIEKDFLLLHHDKHFRLIAKHSKLEAMDFMG